MLEDPFTGDDIKTNKTRDKILGVIGVGTPTLLTPCWLYMISGDG
jgi:hypothetical protein